MHPTDYDTLYCGWQDINRSYDRGNTWTEIPISEFTKTVRAMAQGVNNPDKFYASDRRKLLATSNIHGSPVVWSNVTGFIPVALGGSLQIGGMCVDPANSNELWITLLNYNDTAKVFYTSNGGYNWVNLTGSLPNVPVHSIVHQPGSNNGVYIGTDIGVFYRDGTMSDWQYFGNGLPNTQVTDMKILNGKLYAATYGRGVWRSNVWSVCPTENLLTQANDPSPPNYTGIQRYNVSNLLVSTRIVTGGVGTDVIYRAGGSVTLEPGFEARYNNLFEAKIGGCLD